MRLGIIGLGMVGSTIYNVLSNYHKDIRVYDIKLEHTNILDIIDTDIVFICVPTNCDSNNKCDISIVSKTIDKLLKLNYTGIICIKSTIIPESTINYIKYYSNERICFFPEFLKERQAIKDFSDNKLCIIGTINISTFNIIKECHSVIYTEFKMVHPTEAEITKYFLNVYNVTRILYANTFYEICKINNINYSNIIETLVKRGDINGNYLACNDNLRGPSGPCIVKDTVALNEYVKTKSIKQNFLPALVADIKLYKPTTIN